MSHGTATARLAETHAGPDVGRQLAEVIEREIGREGWIRHRGHNTGVTLGQISWALTVAACVIAAILVLISGYVGYFAVLLAIAAAAAINLR